MSECCSAVVSQHRYGNQNPKITDTAEPKFRVTILLEKSIFREHLSPGCCSPPCLPLLCTNRGRWSLQAQKPPSVSRTWHGACGELGHLGPGWGIPSAEVQGHGAGEKIPGGTGLARQQDVGQSAGAWKQQPQAGQGHVEAGVAEEDGGCSMAYSSPGRVLSAQHAVPRPHSTSATGWHGLRSPRPRGLALLLRGPSPIRPCSTVPTAPVETQHLPSTSGSPRWLQPSRSDLAGCHAAPPAEGTRQPGMSVWTGAESWAVFF